MSSEAFERLSHRRERYIMKCTSENLAMEVGNLVPLTHTKKTGKKRKRDAGRRSRSRPRAAVEQRYGGGEIASSDRGTIGSEHEDSAHDTRTGGRAFLTEGIDSEG